MCIVKNIIKGYRNKFDIEEVTFFENDRVLYSGTYEKFISTSHDDIYLYQEMQRILNSEAKKCINHNDKKLFIFL